MSTNKLQQDQSLTAIRRESELCSYLPHDVMWLIHIGIKRQHAIVLSTRQHFLENLKKHLEFELTVREKMACYHKNIDRHNEQLDRLYQEIYKVWRHRAAKGG